jgi:hypothetical protein
MSSEAHLPDDETSHDVGHFPGDPRFLGYVLIPTEDVVKALQQNQWLSTHLLDSIIQRAGIRPEYSVDPFAPFLGSLGAETYISSMNLTASLQRHQVKKAVVWKESQEKIKQLRENLYLLFNSHLQPLGNHIA